jgi:hypothetical protein
MALKTESELTFERYLDAQNIGWTRVPTSTQKQPDYRIDHNSGTCLFEVKEFDDPAVAPSGGFSPCPPIKAKIRAAAKQFKQHRSDCCTLVLWSSNFHRSVQPQVVLSAAFGEYVRQTISPLGAEPNRYHYSGRAELRPDCNTTFSAIAILAPYELNHLWLEAWRKLDSRRQHGEEITTFDHFNLLQDLSPEGHASYSYRGTIRIVVIENPYARIAFPLDLFAGPFDQRWRMQSGWFRLAFIGSELERLKNDGVPFIYL